MAKKIKLPVLVVNFKAYKEATGMNAVHLAKEIERAALKAKKSVVIAVEIQDLRLIANTVKIPVFAEHVDADKYGAHTGSIIPEAILEAGAAGSLINHAEKELTDWTVKKTIDRCREVGLVSLVCANTVSDAKRLSEFNPDFIAVEPPELIGGDISVSSANPEIVLGTVNAVKKGVPVLCGAGVKSGMDVKASITLGAKGVLLASGVAKSKTPYNKMIELLAGL